MCRSNAENFTTGTSQILVRSPIEKRSQLRCLTKTNQQILENRRLDRRSTATPSELHEDVEITGGSMETTVKKIIKNNNNNKNSIPNKKIKVYDNAVVFLLRSSTFFNKI